MIVLAIEDKSCTWIFDITSTLTNFLSIKHSSDFLARTFLSLRALYFFKKVQKKEECKCYCKGYHELYTDISTILGYETKHKSQLPKPLQVSHLYAGQCELNLLKALFNYRSWWSIKTLDFRVIGTECCSQHEPPR